MISARFVPVEDRAFVTVDVDLAEAVWAEPATETDVLCDALSHQFPLSEAVVRLRYRATPEQIRRVDTAALRGFAADAGVAHLSIQPDPVRAERARVAGLDEAMGELEAVDAWIGSQSPPLSEARARALRERTCGYLAEVGA